MNNWKATPRDNVLFEDSQRCAESRWLTDGTNNHRNYNLSMWPDNILTILCYFFAAIPSLKVL